MKKKKIKNLAVVAIALFGFAIIGTNVVSGYENLYPDPGNGGGGGELPQLYRHSCSHYNNYWECQLGVTQYTCDKWTNCP